MFADPGEFDAALPGLLTDKIPVFEDSQVALDVTSCRLPSV
jgi:hypothetical protein